jgi:hypothetical protein
MRTIISLYHIMLAGLALALPGSVSAQAPMKAGLYSFHTDKMGACPGLDWHITVEPSGKVAGMVGWDAMTHMAKLEGTVQPDGKFTMNAKEVNGARTAVVTGSAVGEYVTITITGTGGPCDGTTVQVPRATGGGAG